MAVIKKSADAPDDLNLVLLGNATIDFSDSSTLKTEDYDLVGNAEIHPYLEVEREKGEVLAPSGSVTTASAESANPSSKPDSEVTVPAEEAILPAPRVGGTK